ncbi:MAG: hypothetical protein HXX09_10970 [Bacteroidetes bacterium]|nr:hypothetical protein [Bacteroidota bacterium]
MNRIKLISEGCIDHFDVNENWKCFSFGSIIKVLDHDKSFDKNIELITDVKLKKIRLFKSSIFYLSKDGILFLFKDFNYRGTNYKILFENIIDFSIIYNKLYILEKDKISIYNLNPELCLVCDCEVGNICMNIITIEKYVIIFGPSVLIIYESNVDSIELFFKTTELVEFPLSITFGNNKFYIADHNLGLIALKIDKTFEYLNNKFPIFNPYSVSWINTQLYVVNEKGLYQINENEYELIDNSFSILEIKTYFNFLYVLKKDRVDYLNEKFINVFNSGGYHFDVSINDNYLYAATENRIIKFDIDNQSYQNTSLFNHCVRHYAILSFHNHIYYVTENAFFYYSINPKGEFSNLLYKDENIGNPVSLAYNHEKNILIYSTGMLLQLLDVSDTINRIKDKILFNTNINSISSIKNIVFLSCGFGGVLYFDLKTPQILKKIKNISFASDVFITDKYLSICTSKELYLFQHESFSKYLCIYKTDKQNDVSKCYIINHYLFYTEGEKINKFDITTNSITKKIRMPFIPRKIFACSDNDVLISGINGIVKINFN